MAFFSRLYLWHKEHLPKHDKVLKSLSVHSGFIRQYFYLFHPEKNKMYGPLFLIVKHTYHAPNRNTPLLLPSKTSPFFWYYLWLDWHYLQVHFCLLNVQSMAHFQSATLFQWGLTVTKSLSKPWIHSTGNDLRKTTTNHYKDAQKNKTLQKQKWQSFVDLSSRLRPSNHIIWRAGFSSWTSSGIQRHQAFFLTAAWPQNNNLKIWIERIEAIKWYKESTPTRASRAIYYKSVNRQCLNNCSTIRPRQHSN